MTRRQLIRAARLIFARDGFEQARIEDIAQTAGKTRGAFYSNFKDKEDVFFAIFEEDLTTDKEIHEDLSRQVKTQAQRVDLLCQRLMTLLRDRQRILLYLEFKMYSIRHVDGPARLSKLHMAICLRYCTGLMIRVIPMLERAPDEELLGVAAEIGALIDGFAINQLFLPDSMGEEDTLSLLRSYITDVVGRRTAEPQG